MEAYVSTFMSNFENFEGELEGLSMNWYLSSEFEGGNRNCSIGYGALYELYATQHGLLLNSNVKLGVKVL